MSHSRITGVSSLVAAVGIVLAVVLLWPESPRDSGPALTPASPSADASLEPPTVVRSSPQQFCGAFRGFAGAHSQHLAEPSEETAAFVLDASAALIDLGVPVGLSTAGYAALAQLVDGVLGSVDGSEVLQERLCRLAADAAPDGPALDRYLTDVCPA